MSTKFFLKSAGVISLLAIAALIFLTQSAGITLSEFIAGLALYALYGILVISFILRIGLIFVGVFAIYKVIWSRINKQYAV